MTRHRSKSRRNISRTVALGIWSLVGLAINIIEFSIFSQMARWSRAGFGANVEIAAASNELHDDETAAEGAR